MKHRHSGIIGLLVGLFLLAVSITQAGVPGVMTYKGQLLDAGGQPVNGTNTIDFKLYSVESGGSAFWSETQTVTVASGSFTVQLGDNAANLINDNLLDGNTWLGITMAGGTEMTPRQKMTTVAYSLRAKVAESVTSSDSLIPAGSIMAYAGTTAPVGWKFCDGASLDRTTYSKLFTAIGTSHGSSSGTTFNVPDYRGRFLRGVDHAAGRDPNKVGRTAAATGGNTGDTVGSVQGNSTKLPGTGFTGTVTGSGSTTPNNTGGQSATHTHNQKEYQGSDGGPNYSTHTAGTIINWNPNLTTSAASNDHTHYIPSLPVSVSGSATITGGGDNETRPINANVEYIIKY